MKLIVGLGNPGSRYESTRHNAGFIILNQIRHGLGFEHFKPHGKFNVEISEGNHGNEKIVLLEPHSFMNRSGDEMKKYMQFYKIPLEDTIILHDDLDIELGKYKIAENSSAAGHNGILNIIANFGTQNFKRVRIGIEGAEKKKDRTIPGDEFVLQKFSDEELAALKDLARKIEKEIL